MDFVILSDPWKENNDDDDDDDDDDGAFIYS